VRGRLDEVNIGDRDIGRTLESLKACVQPSVIYARAAPSGHHQYHDWQETLAAEPLILRPESPQQSACLCVGFAIQIIVTHFGFNRMREPTVFVLHPFNDKHTLDGQRRLGEAHVYCHAGCAFLPTAKELVDGGSSSSRSSSPVNHAEAPISSSFNKSPPAIASFGYIRLYSHDRLYSYRIIQKD